MGPNPYDIGDVVRLSVAFAIDGTPEDPTAIALTIKLPDGTTATYTYAAGEVIRDSAGNYHYDYQPGQPGFYEYRWAGTGAAIAASQSQFWVRALNV